MTWAPCPHGVRTREKKHSDRLTAVRMAKMLASACASCLPRSAVSQLVPHSNHGFTGSIRSSPFLPCDNWNLSTFLSIAWTRRCESLRVPSGYSENFGTNGQHRGLLGGVHLMILELESVPVRLDARVRVNFFFVSGERMFFEVFEELRAFLARSSLGII